jgi:hypothetical protein
VIIALNSTNYLTGTVQTYNPVTGAMTATLVATGAGTATILNLLGLVGSTGATGSSKVSFIDISARTTDIGSATLFSVPASGMYRISEVISVTTAATTSSTLPSSAFAWTQAESGVPQSIVATTLSGGNSTTTTYAQAAVIVYAQIGTNITYSTTGYASSGATSMQYSIHIIVEAL